MGASALVPVAALGVVLLIPLTIASIIGVLGWVRDAVDSL